MKNRFSWKQLSLVTRITIIITLFLILPTFLIGYFYYHSYQNSLLTEADRNMSNLLEQEISIIDHNLSIAKERMNQISYNLELVYFLDSVSDPSEREQTLFLQELTSEWINIQYVCPDLFSEMILYTKNEKLTGETAWKLQILPFSSLEQDFQQEDQILFGSCQNKSSDTQEAVLTSQTAALPVYYPVRNISTNVLIGVVELQIPLEELTQWKDMESNDRFQLSLLDGEKTPLLQNHFSANPADRTMSVSIASTDLVLQIGVSTDDITKSARSMIFRVLLVAALGIAAVMTAIYILVRRMLDRLLTLDHVMNQMEQGNLSIEIQEDGWNDEVSHLKRHFKRMTASLDAAIQEKQAEENARKDAEFHALQAQINPHFLYNTLESMIMQCEIDRYYIVGDALSALSRVLRYALRWDNHEASMWEEWKHLENYIAIMSMRLEDDFSCHLELDEKARNQKVPKMFLQPLVENSFLHGFRQVPAPWHLEVTGRILNSSPSICTGDDSYGRTTDSESCLLIEITDNGSGITPERMNELSHALENRSEIRRQDRHNSIGVINVRKRLDSVNPGSQFVIDNQEEGGIKIRITIPIL